MLLSKQSGWQGLSPLDNLYAGTGIHRAKGGVQKKEMQKFKTEAKCHTSAAPVREERVSYGEQVAMRQNDTAPADILQP